MLLSKLRSFNLFNANHKPQITNHHLINIFTQTSAKNTQFCVINVITLSRHLKFFKHEANRLLSLIYVSLFLYILVSLNLASCHAHRSEENHSPEGGKQQPVCLGNSRAIATATNLRSKFGAVDQLHQSHPT